MLMYCNYTLIPCILINYHLYSISHEEIKRDGNGEREMPTMVHFASPQMTSKDQKSSIMNCLGGSLTNGLVQRLCQKEWSIG